MSIASSARRVLIAAAMLAVAGFAQAQDTIKLGLVAVGVVVMAAQKREAFAPAALVTPAAKTLALLSITVWFVAIAAGRLMAYPGLFFGL